MPVTPITVLTPTGNYQEFTFGYHGPYIVDANTSYLEYHGFATVIKPFTIPGILKSTDGGLTWIQLDEANAPHIQRTTLNAPGNTSSAWSGPGGKILIVFISGDGAGKDFIYIQTFDLTTELYVGGPVNTGIEVVANSDQNQLISCWHSSGNIAFAWANLNIITGDIESFIALHDGVATLIGPFTFPFVGGETNVQKPFQRMIEGHSGLIHTLLQQETGVLVPSIQRGINLITCDIAGIFGTIQQLAVGLNAFSQAPSNSICYDPVTQKISIPISNYDDGGTQTDTKVNIFQGLSVLNTAVVSIGTVTTPGVLDISPETLACTIVGSNLTIFWGDSANIYISNNINTPVLISNGGTGLVDNLSAAAITSTTYTLAWPIRFYLVNILGPNPPGPCPCYLHCPGGDALQIFCSPCDPPLICCTCTE
jgi:hypothetical protein